MSDAHDLATGLIRFVDSYRPALPDGDYDIVVGQRLSAAGAAPFDEAYAHRRRLRVEGPRFTLRPDLVAAVFPPASGRGEYRNVLPHVVLNRKTLPWERTAGAPTATDSRPWLAVLVFHAEDAVPGAAPPWQSRSLAVRELAAAGPAVTSYPDAQLANWLPEADECQVIDVPAPLWASVAPRVEDLHWLTHAREVSGATSGEFSVVVANRLPHANQPTSAHLVSLEGMADVLPGGSRSPTTGVVRLVSLWRWTFTSVDPRETFGEYLKRLDVGPLRMPQADPVATTTTTAAPTAAPAEDAAEAERILALGYVPTGHVTTSGDRTISWLRGPLVPYRTAGLQPEAVVRFGSPARTADELLRYDPTTGMLDVTYAVAFELGRLLTLQDTAVASALTGWKHENIQADAIRLERAVLAERLGAFLDLSGGSPPDASTLHRAVAAMLTAADFGTPPVPGPEAAKRQPMASPATGADAVAELVAVRRSGDDFTAATPLPVSVTQWLARLRLLLGVPLSHLVASPALVPPESLRFFAVDPAWVACLIEGAFSLGRSSPTLDDHDASVHSLLHAATDQSSSTTTAASLVTGFLLRSALVAGWPSLDIRMYDSGGNLLRPLRSERLAADLRFHLVEGDAARLVIAEPAEGLHFGVDPVTDPVDTERVVGYRKARRATDGTLLPMTVDVPVRASAGGLDTTTGVLDIAALAHRLAREDGQTPTAASAEFAFQLVEGVEAVAFDLTAVDRGR